MAEEIKIGSKTVGERQPMFIIGEVGLAHDGSLGAAHSFIDALAKTGADAIKFQTHIATSESSKYEDFRVKVFPQDKTRPEYWERTSFEKSQWIELSQHAKEKGLTFLSSPFSHDAVDLLSECGVPAWKVASGEVTNLPLLKHMAETGKPVLISSGMSSWVELDKSLDFLREQNSAVGLFQCTTSYPCPPEQWGLNIITEMVKKYRCPVGLSDHSGTIVPSLAAHSLGASMLEFHIVFDRDQFGPDSKASLTFPEVKNLVQAVRMLETARENPVNKDKVAANSQKNRQLFFKGLYAARDLTPGKRLEHRDIHVRKPLLGISAADYFDVQRKEIKAVVKQGDPILYEHLS